MVYLINEIKNMYIQNKLGLISLLLFFMMLYLETILLDIYLNGFLIFIIILTYLACFINEVIVIKNYIVKKFNGIYDMKYNSCKTIIFHSLRIYFKYILLFIVILLIIIFILCVIFTGAVVNHLIHVFGDDIYNEELIIEYITEYFDTIIKPQFTFIFPFIFTFLIFLILPMFFKLLFIKNVLTFKQENYKSKYIVRQSFTIIKTNIIFYILTYFGINILLVYLNEIIFKNNYIYMFFEAIIQIFLFMIYQIKFVEKQANEYKKLNKNIL